MNEVERKKVETLGGPSSFVNGGVARHWYRREEEKEEKEKEKEKEATYIMLWLTCLHPSPASVTMHYSLNSSSIHVYHAPSLSK